MRMEESGTPLLKMLGEVRRGELDEIAREIRNRVSPVAASSVMLFAASIICLVMVVTVCPVDSVEHRWCVVRMGEDEEGSKGMI